MESTVDAKTLEGSVSSESSPLHRRRPTLPRYTGMTMDMVTEEKSAKTLTSSTAEVLNEKPSLPSFNDSNEEAIVSIDEPLPVFPHEAEKYALDIPAILAADINATPQIKNLRLDSKEADLGLLSKTTFQWMWSLIRLGNSKNLMTDDIWLTMKERETDLLLKRFLTIYVRKRDQGQPNALFWALHGTFIWDFWIGGILLLISSLMMVGAPYTLRYFLEYVGYSYYAPLDNLKPPPLRDGIGYVVGLTMMIFLQSIFSNHASYRGVVVGGGVRNILSMMICRTALERAKSGEIDEQSGSEQSTYQPPQDASKPPDQAPVKALSQGQVLGLFTADTARINRVVPGLHSIWTGPVVIFATLALLIANLKYSALPGVGLLFLSVPGIGTMVMILLAKRQALLRIMDKRTALLYEVLNAVRFVKLFGWEDTFFQRIEIMRSAEIRASTRLLAVRNVVAVISISLPIFAAMLSFITYRLTGHALNAASSFSSVALFNVLRLPLASLPTVIYQAVDAWAALKRVEGYVEQLNLSLAEDTETQVIARPTEKSEIMTPILTVTAASFRWPADSSETEESAKSKLKVKKAQKTKDNKDDKAIDEKDSAVTATNESDLSIKKVAPGGFSIPLCDFTLLQGELVAVIGRVGSGKSSLLAALAGEMPLLTGSVEWASSHSICTQSAWIWNATIRQNVLFGKPMEEKWYASVLTACGLTQDLVDLSDGDLTMIGEKGVTLSGGQKQRISLARAIYANRDSILLDDVLSALDARVANAVFENAICGLLQDKLRILVTHNLHLLPRCDRVLWIEGGVLRANGTFNELITHDKDFRRLVATELNEKSVLEAGSKAKTESAADENKECFEVLEKATQAQEDVGTVVPWKVYYEYLTAYGNPPLGMLMVILLIVAQGASTITLLWLSWWVRGKFDFKLSTYVGIYVALSFVQAALFYIFTFVMTSIALKSNKRLFDTSLTKVLQAQMAFFDVTPLGHIIKRFSSDSDEMDDELMDGLRLFLLSGAAMVAVWVVIIVYLHWFGVALGAIIPLWVILTRTYRVAGRGLEQCEATLYSRVLSRFGQILSGSQTIRLFKAEKTFDHDLAASLDDFDSATNLSFAAQKWHAVRLDLLGNSLLAVTGALILKDRFTTHPTSVGLVTALALGISGNMQFIIKNFAALERSMASVVRVHEYSTKLDAEGGSSQGQLETVSEAWPESGAVNFEQVSMRYRPGLPLVLREFSLQIKAGERVGFVGRTGAGKTSIMNLLCKLYAPDRGTITIDGQDISRVGFKELRSKLAVVPQDPTLLRGTIRSNLDPFSHHSDLELWSALRRVGLAPANGTHSSETAFLPSLSFQNKLQRSDSEETVVEGVKVEFSKTADDDDDKDDDENDKTSEPKPDFNSNQYVRLDDPVSEGGTNFSVGQRQLLSLARAIIKDSRIVICDEVTASVDPATDARIQTMMQEIFSGKTVLCIAHRLRTILKYDRICVMGQGQVVECGEPLELFLRGNGAFRTLCEESKITARDFVAAGEGVE